MHSLYFDHSESNSGFEPLPQCPKAEICTTGQCKRTVNGLYAHVLPEWRNNIREILSVFVAFAQAVLHYFVRSEI